MCILKELEMDSNISEAGSNHQLEQEVDEENRLKNRYLNVSAHAHSRIRINASCGSDTNGYINANYVDVRFGIIGIGTLGPTNTYIMHCSFNN